MRLLAVLLVVLPALARAEAPCELMAEWPGIRPPECGLWQRHDFP
jgi:hypothetical protein